MTRVRSVVAITLPLLAMLLPAVGGCSLLRGLGWLLAPPDIQKPEYTLTETGKLAIVIESANPDEENPVFARALHAKLAELLREKPKSPAVVPWNDVVALRQRNADYSRLSLQQIGRQLGAEQVLYLRCDRLRLRSTPDSPIYSPSVTLRARLIGVKEPSDAARLWPAEPDGREYQQTRPVREPGPLADADSEMAKLARDLAHHLIVPFYETNLEIRPPVEP